MTATSERHCEEGRSPDVAIQKWLNCWITTPPAEARDDALGKISSDKQVASHHLTVFAGRHREPS